MVRKLSLVKRSVKAIIARQVRPNCTTESCRITVGG
jgi:hypothetical protein